MQSPNYKMLVITYYNRVRIICNQVQTRSYNRLQPSKNQLSIKYQVKCFIYQVY